MPSIPANASKFRMSSDYPMDKIVYLYEGSQSIGAGSAVNIAHGLGFIPLPMLQWSYNSDFSTAYEIGTGPFPSGNNGYPFSLEVHVKANGTNIVITGVGITSPTTVYLRIFAFAPSDYTGTVASTKSLGDTFVINSDYNYMKLVAEGKETVSAGSSTTITHNLGFIPHVLTWYNDGTYTYPIEVSDPATSSLPYVNTPYAEVNTTQLILYSDSSISNTIHYRYYYNE